MTFVTSRQLSPFVHARGVYLLQPGHPAAGPSPCTKIVVSQSMQFPLAVGGGAQVQAYPLDHQNVHSNGCMDCMGFCPMLRQPLICAHMVLQAHPFAVKTDDLCQTLWKSKAVTSCMFHLPEPSCAASALKAEDRLLWHASRHVGEAVIGDGPRGGMRSGLACIQHGQPSQVPCAVCKDRTARVQHQNKT